MGIKSMQNTKRLFALLFVVSLFVFLTGCSIQRKIEKKYVGKGRELLIRDFGEPTEIFKMKNGSQQFLYKKESTVKAAVINQGKPSLDPMISPSFMKIEIYQFTIDSLGNILNSSYKRINQ